MSRPFLIHQRYLHHSLKTMQSIPRLALKKNAIKLPADPTSTVYRGKLFELHTLQAFESLGMTLIHMGGKSDGGIDLRGEWKLDDGQRRIPVVVQCKNVKSGCTPDHLRGLLGAAVGLNAARPTLALLSTSATKTYTPDTMSLFNASTLPLGLARVSSDAILQALVLNHAAQHWLDIQIHPRFDPLGNLLSPPLIIT